MDVRSDDLLWNAFGANIGDSHRDDSTSGASAHDLGWPSGFSRFSSLHPPGAEELHSNVENGTEGAT
jgi:hypothetical protein